MQKGIDANDFLREIYKFVAWLSSVRKLHLESNIKLFTYMHSEVLATLDYDEGKPLADMTQSVVVVSELLLNNLDYVILTGLQGNSDKVNLVRYILKNVIVLNELWMGVYVYDVVKDEDGQIGKEYKFYKACFRLPITLSTTRVVFSGQYLRESNDRATSHNEIVLYI
ncbi:Replicase polyprotein 1a [Bienertia sinuspersici]